MKPFNKPDDLTKYREELEAARQYRESKGFDDLWRRLIDMYRGKHFPKSMTHQDRLNVNIAFSTINTLAPAVALNYPKFTVEPTHPELETRAVTVEAALNYEWKHHDMQDEFRLAVNDFLFMGHGWLKVGWRFVEIEREAEPDELQAEFDRQRMEVELAAMMNPETAGELPSDDDILAAIGTTLTEVVEDRPTVERVSPFDMFVDVEATSMRDARWLCHRVVRPLEDVRKDSMYKRRARREVQPDMAVHADAYKDDYDKLPPHAQRVTIYELWDLTTRKFCVFAENGGFLIEPTDFPFAFGHPFLMLRNYEVPDQFYPIGDLEMLESLQDELDETRSDIMNFRKKEARKYMVRETAIGERGKAALLSDRDNEIVPIEDSTPFSEVIAPVPQNPINPQIFDYSEMIESDMNVVSGVSEYARGATPEVRRTATEAAIIQDAANSRASDKLNRIEKFLSAVGRRLCQALQEFLTVEKVARITGPEGAYEWHQYDPESIQGEFDFSVEGGSTQPQNETFRRQNAVALMQVVAPFLQMGVVDPTQLALHVLREGFNVRNPEKFISPMAQMMQQMQMAQMLGGGAPPEEGGGDVGGEPGMNGEQPMPDERAEAEAAGSAPLGGVPAGALAQLAGQVGLQGV